MTLKVMIHSLAEPPERQMRLFLKQQGNTVKLMGLTELGAELTILHIDEDGLRRVGGISTTTTGWPIDEKGRVRLAE